jgi:hypothetical protein
MARFVAFIALAAVATAAGAARALANPAGRHLAAAGRRTAVTAERRPDTIEPAEQDRGLAPVSDLTAPGPWPSPPRPCLALALRHARPGCALELRPAGRPSGKGGSGGHGGFGRGGWRGADQRARGAVYMARSDAAERLEPTSLGGPEPAPWGVRSERSETTPEAARRELAPGQVRSEPMEELRDDEPTAWATTLAPVKESGGIDASSRESCRADGDTRRDVLSSAVPPSQRRRAHAEPEPPAIGLVISPPCPAPSQINRAWTACDAPVTRPTEKGVAGGADGGSGAPAEGAGFETGVDAEEVNVGGADGAPAEGAGFETGADAEEVDGGGGRLGREERRRVGAELDAAAAPRSLDIERMPGTGALCRPPPSRTRPTRLRLSRPAPAHSRPVLLALAPEPRAAFAAPGSDPLVHLALALRRPRHAHGGPGAAAAGHGSTRMPGHRAGESSSPIVRAAAEQMVEPCPYVAATLPIQDGDEPPD